VKAIHVCPVCKAEDLVPYAMSPAAPGALHFAQSRCSNCGLLLAQPQATQEEMDTYYGGQYYETEWPDPDAVWQSNSKANASNELPLMEALWRRWPPRTGGHAVEIGCGYGVMLGTLRNRGFDVTGCDPSARAVEHCRSKGLDVLKAQSPGAPFPPHVFDLAISLHVIEHVADPRAFVRELVGFVKPGGVAVIVTEDAWISEYQWERVKSRLTGRMPPFRSSCDHTYVFQGHHLRDLLLQEGCEEVKVRSYRPRVRESLHWRLYKAPFRFINQITRHGPLLMAIGRKAMQP
jgi:SAM-dependent methyltransferase